MNKFTSLGLSFLGIFIATNVLANGSFKSKVNYVNQNGCRVFDMVVSPDCPYDLAPRACAITEKALQKIVGENPALSMKVSCSRLHTGDLAKRILEETLMQSPSFDGYTIKMNLTSQVKGGPLKIETSFVNGDTCLLAAGALKSFDKKGLNVSSACSGERLFAQLQF